MAILLVEDDETVRELLARVLQRAGFEVVVASSGEEAVALARAVPVDLLVCDVCLPGQSGPALAHELTESRPDLRTLLMSGDPALDALIGNDLDAVFLGKPFTTTAFMDNVRQMLAR